ncbi:SGNH hydrolase [Auriculariales sp. MPI-PUGE-AT-0066]|nr:SGNH hydrolase [Auriculariales sp. MPI-PUGE-AT-0066]
MLPLVQLISLLLAATATSGRPLQKRATLGFVAIGDSTTNNGTSTNSGGWINGFCASLSGVPLAYCANEAHNGASTNSTISSGQFATALNTIKSQVAAGRKVYATVQFGHNDQKIGDASAMGVNLQTMVDQIRSAGGEPILVTPLTRRTFSNGVISDSLGPFADETIRVAGVKSTKYIDLHTESIRYCNAIGETECHNLNKSSDDNTHLNANGTTVFGRMVALLIKAKASDVTLVTNTLLDCEITKGKPLNAACT